MFDDLDATFRMMSPRAAGSRPSPTASKTNQATLARETRGKNKAGDKLGESPED